MSHNVNVSKQSNKGAPPITVYEIKKLDDESSQYTFKGNVDDTFSQDNAGAELLFLNQGQQLNYKFSFNHDQHTSYLEQNSPQLECSTNQKCIEDEMLEFAIFPSPTQNYKKSQISADQIAFESKCVPFDKFASNKKKSMQKSQFYDKSLVSSPIKQFLMEKNEKTRLIKDHDFQFNEQNKQDENRQSIVAHLKINKDQKENEQSKIMNDEDLENISIGTESLNSSVSQSSKHDDEIQDTKQSLSSNLIRSAQPLSSFSNMSSDYCDESDSVHDIQVAVSNLDFQHKRKKRISLRCEKQQLCNHLKSIQQIHTNVRHDSTNSLNKYILTQQKQKQFKFKLISNVLVNLHQKQMENKMQESIRLSINDRNKLRVRKLSKQPEEKKSNIRQVLDFRFEPNTGFKLRWDLVVIFLSIYNSVVTPQQFAFSKTYDNLTIIKYIDAILDTIFALDIIIMFRTNYRDPTRDIVISDAKQIAINYIKGRFIIDLLASFPFDIILQIQEDQGGNSKYIDSSAGNFIQLIKLIRLLRLGRLISYIKFIGHNIKFGMKFAQMLLFVLIFINLISCFWIKMFHLTPSDFVIDDYDLEELFGAQSSEEFIIESLIRDQGYPLQLPGKLKSTLAEYYNQGNIFCYIVMVFMTSFNIMGNDIQPTKDSMFWKSSLIMFVGFLIISNLIGEFSNIINDFYESDTNNEIEENLIYTEQLMQNMQLPEYLQDRITKSLDRNSVSIDYIRSQKFYSLISESQKQAVKKLFIQDCIQNLGLFPEYEEQVQLKFLIDNFVIKVYLEDDIIVKQGDMAGKDENVYFIFEGNANVMLEKRDFCYFNQENVNLFLNEHEEEVLENVDEKMQESFIENLLKRRYNAYVKELQEDQRNQEVDVMNELLQNIKAILGENLMILELKTSLDYKFKQILKGKALKDDNEVQISENLEALVNKIMGTKEVAMEQSTTMQTAKRLKYKKFIHQVFNYKKQKNFIQINQLGFEDQQQYFGEMAAITNLRRTCNVIANSTMLLGLIKNPTFLDLYKQSNGFKKKVTERIFSYRDFGTCMLTNMIRNAQLFGSNILYEQQFYMEVFRCLKEDSFHNMDTILQLGEISDRLYFVTAGQVGVFINMSSDYVDNVKELDNDGWFGIVNDDNLSLNASRGTQDLKPKKKYQHLATLNIGSNFNHSNALLGQQSIFIYKAFGSNTRVSYLTKEQYLEICKRHNSVEEFHQVVEQLYNQEGKKYDYQRYMHQYHWMQGMGVKKPVETLHQQQSFTHLDSLRPSNKNCQQIIIDNDSDSFSDLESMDQSNIDGQSAVNLDIIQSSYAPNSIHDKESSDCSDITSFKNDQPKEMNIKEKRKSVFIQDQGLIKKELQRSALNIQKKRRYSQKMDQQGQSGGLTINKSSMNDLIEQMSLHQREKPAFLRKKFDFHDKNKFEEVDDDLSKSNDKSNKDSAKLTIEADNTVQNPFMMQNQQIIKSKKQQKEEHAEEILLAQLKQNHNWNKVSAQIKFKNAIRNLIKLKKKNKEEFVQRFEIFRQVDMLYKARLARMINLRMKMAESMIEQNTTGLLMVDKMNNLAAMTQYFNKNLKVNKQITQFTKESDFKVKKAHQQYLKQLKTLTDFYTSSNQQDTIKNTPFKFKGNNSQVSDDDSTSPAQSRNHFDNIFVRRWTIPAVKSSKKNIFIHKFLTAEEQLLKSNKLKGDEAVVNPRQTRSTIMNLLMQPNQQPQIEQNFTSKTKNMNNEIIKVGDSSSLLPPFQKQQQRQDTPRFSNLISDINEDNTTINCQRSQFYQQTRVPVEKDEGGEENDDSQAEQSESRSVTDIDGEASIMAQVQSEPKWAQFKKVEKNSLQPLSTLQSTEKDGHLMNKQQKEIKQPNQQNILQQNIRRSNYLKHQKCCQAQHSWSPKRVLESNFNQSQLKKVIEDESVKEKLQEQQIIKLMGKLTSNLQMIKQMVTEDNSSQKIQFYSNKETRITLASSLLSKQS